MKRQSIINCVLGAALALSFFAGQSRVSRTGKFTRIDIVDAKGTIVGRIDSQGIRFEEDGSQAMLLSGGLVIRSTESTIAITTSSMSVKNEGEMTTLQSGGLYTTTDTQTHRVTPNGSEDITFGPLGREYRKGMVAQ